MSAMRNGQGRASRWAALLSGVVALLLVAAGAPAAHAGKGDASVLKGTWIGTYSGYDADGYKSGQEKLVISEVKGTSARGTWQYRSSAKKRWSKPRPMTFSVFDQEEFVGGGMAEYIGGVDERGIYTGKYDSSDDTLIFAYASQSQNLLTLTLNLERKK